MTLIFVLLALGILVLTVLGALFHDRILSILWWPIGKLIEWASGGRGS